jgi:hypothetical protein
MMTSNIQDDWEEVQPMIERTSLDSAAASVHSLDDSFDFSLNEPSPPTSPLQENVQHPSSECPPYTEAPGRDSAGLLTVTHPTAEESGNTKSISQTGDAVSVHSTGTNAEDLLDIEVEPPVLLSSITSIIATLVETISSTSDLSTASREDDFYLPNILSECHTLYKLLSELERVVSCYADSWKPDGNVSETVPLDPAIYKWISDFMINLLGLQATVQKEVELPGGNPEDLSTELVRHLSFVVESREMLDNFLPIIKVYVSYITKGTRDVLLTHELETSMNFRPLISHSRLLLLRPHHQDGPLTSFISPVPTLMARYLTSVELCMR